MSTIKISEVKLNKVSEKYNGRKYDDSVTIKDIEIPLEDLVTAIVKSNPEFLRSILEKVVEEEVKNKKEEENKINNYNSLKPFLMQPIYCNPQESSKAMERFDKALKEGKNMDEYHLEVNGLFNENIYDDIYIINSDPNEILVKLIFKLIPVKSEWLKLYDKYEKNTEKVILNQIIDRGIVEVYNDALYIKDTMKKPCFNYVSIPKDIIIKGLYYISPSRRDWIISLINLIDDVGSLTNSQILEKGLDLLGFEKMMKMAIINKQYLDK